MAVDIKVTRKLPDNYVQVDVTPKNMETRHYKMPADQVDSFTASYKQYDSKTRVNSTVLLVLMVLAGAFTGTIIPKLLKANTLFRVIGGVIGAFAGDIGSTMITAKNMEKNETALLKAHGAKELIYNKPNPILNSGRA